MNKSHIKDFLLLQISFLVYSLSSLVGKFSAGYEVMSVGFIGFYALEIVILGIYAILWQQAIKKYELSIAYANKAVTLIWALIFGATVFKDAVKPHHIIGIAIVIAGIVILNLPSKDAEKKEDEA